MVVENNYLISDSGIKGQIELFGDLKEGDYMLVAYSSWMENFGVKDVFKKRILIQNDTKKNYRLIPV